MRLGGRRGWDGGKENGVKTGEIGGEGGREIGVKTGESGGAAGGRGLCSRRRGEPFGGRKLNVGEDLRWSTTLFGFSHRSVTDSVVGLAGQSKQVRNILREEITVRTCIVIYFPEP